MNMRKALTLSAVLALALSCLPGQTMAQQKSLKEQLIGTWNLVSVSEVFQDGKTQNPWGPNVKGAVTFDPNGKMLFMIIGADLPSPSGKPQESGRLVVAYFGTYAVDEAAKTITYTAERATTPRFDGLPRKASVTISGDELMQQSAAIATPQGTFTPHLVLRRAK
jgi:hypothetical protein